MKKIITVLLLLTSTAAFSQSCFNVVSAFFTNPSFDGMTYDLTINYTTTGNKSLETTVKCGSTQIFYDCFTANGAGTKIYNGLVCASGINGISAIFVPHTGNCGSAACGSTLVLPPGGGPLAMKLSAYTATRSGENVQLFWHAEPDPEAKEFYIERADKNEFQTEQVIPAVRQTIGSDYFYSDKNLNHGITKYRLKSIDQNGSFSYSEIKLVKGLNADDINIFPNPGSSNGKINISGINNHTQLEIADLTGRTVLSMFLETGASVDLPVLQKGIYLLRFINKTTGESVTKKLTITR